MWNQPDDVLINKLWLHSSQELEESSRAYKMLFLFFLLKIIYFCCSALKIFEFRYAYFYESMQ